MRKKTQISCAVTAQLISAFVFASQIVQSLYLLNPKFQASSNLLWLYSPICVAEDTFSHFAPHIISAHTLDPHLYTAAHVVSIWRCLKLIFDYLSSNINFWSDCRSDFRQIALLSSIIQFCVIINRIESSSTNLCWHYLPLFE